MVTLVQQSRSRSIALKEIAGGRIVLVLMALVCCFRGQAVGEDKTARQRFVVEVFGVVRMNSVSATAPGELSRVEISSSGEVVLALSSAEGPASSSDAVLLLHSGRTYHLSFRRGTGPVAVQTISLSGQRGVDLTDQSIPILTITSI